MNEQPYHTPEEKRYQDAENRVRKIRKFYKELASYVATSIFLIAINLFISGGIGWAKYPVFFWGIALVFQFVNVLRLQKFDRRWEDKMIKKFAGDVPQKRILEQEFQPDYSEELLDHQPPGKEMADLSEYRKLKRPWKDEDLV